MWGDPPKTKLPSGEKYRYFCPAIRVAFDGLGNATTAAPLLKEYLTAVAVWVDTVEPLPSMYPVRDTFPRLPAPSGFTWNIEPMPFATSISASQ